MHPILFVDLFKQSSYKTTILLSVIHKQLTYFSKKYSKFTRITLSKINKLSVACENDNIKMIKHVHKNTNLIKYNTHILKATKNNSNKIIRFLLNVGLCVDAWRYKTKKSRYHNLLTFSIKYGNKMMLLLLNKGADIHIKKDYVLLYFIMIGNVRLVKYLLDIGANIHAKDDIALELSVIRDDIKMVKLLLNYGANVHAKNEETFLCCVAENKIEMAKLLLDAGANVHARNNIVLHLSVKKGYVEMTELLLDYGADIHTIKLTKMSELLVRKSVEEKLKLI